MSPFIYAFRQAMLEIGLDFVIVMMLATALLILLGMTGITTSTHPSTVSTMVAIEATEVGVVTAMTAMKIEAEALTEVDMAGEETGSLRHPYCWFIPVINQGLRFHVALLLPACWMLGFVGDDDFSKSQGQHVLR